MKSALVTGGSRGIGRAIVERLRHDGWQVATCALSGDGPGHSAADLVLACDVADPGDVARAISSVVDKFGTLQLLVNNAGLAGSNSLEPDSDDELWHRIVDVNLHGTYYMTKRAYPHMADGGQIINIGSVLSHTGVADQSAYTAAKHAVLGFTRAFALHAAERNISVNCICPSWVLTDMARERWAELGINETLAAADTPHGRITTPDDVATLVSHLASSEAGSVTGQAFDTDGKVIA